MRKKSGLWIAGRIGILLVLITTIQICSRIRAHHEMQKWDTFHDYIGKCKDEYKRAEKDTVDSQEWNKDKAEGDMWLGKAGQEQLRILGTNAP